MTKPLAACRLAVVTTGGLYLRDAQAPFDGEAARAGNGIMIGLHADSPAQVDAFHAAALANGGVCEGPPGFRATYGEGYYLAYVRDPTGNKLSAFHRAEAH